MNLERHIKEVSQTLLIAFAIVLFWRGMWGLLDIYLYPHNLVLSYAISIAAGVVILYATQNLLKRLI